MKKLSILLSTVLMLFMYSHVTAQSCTASFTYSPNSSISTGDTVSFSNTSRYNAMSSPFFYWTFGDGSTSTQVSPIHMYSSAGVYAVCLVLTDSSRNCVSTYCDSIQITGSSSSSCKADFSYKIGTASNDKQVSFTNNSTYSGTGASYSWDFGDRSSSTQAAPSHTYNTYGNYLVTLTITSGSCTSTKSIWVNVQSSSSSCKADFTYAPTASNSCIIKFTNRSSSSLSSYWSFGDGNVSSQWSPTHQYARDGYYAVSVTVYDSARTCTSTYTDSIYVRGCGTSSSKCKISAIRAYQDSIDTCKTVLMAITNAFGSSTNITWDFGDRTSGFGNPVTHKYANQGFYLVTATNVDSVNNCSYTYTDTVYGYGCGSSKCSNVVSGSVMCGITYAEYASVYLIEKKGNNLKIVDSVGVDSSGYYTFGSVCNGDYYIKAALQKRDVNYADFLPTYYGGHLRWDSASTTAISSSARSLNIKMILGLNSGGRGFIGGNVRKGANKTAGEPLSQVEIAILDENLEPSAYSYSNTEGAFALPDLAFGKYYLFVDIPGVKSEGIWVELSEEKPEVEDILIEVNLDVITTSVRQNNAAAITEFTLFPNPSNGDFTVELPNEAASLSVMDISGKEIFKSNSLENMQQSINLKGFENGVYNVVIHFRNGSHISKRLIVN
ncbi:MAG: PKD domain-containing protein [Bacteroidia bacterium]